MTVHFIGAGPGAPDLITLRGHRLISEAPVILFAGSLVPQAVLAAARPDATIRDTAPMHLDEIIATIADAHEKGLDVARVHSGDPSIYGAIGEQIRRLNALSIPWDVVPGVPAFAAAAAALGQELTLPDISQTVILTRTAVRTSAMPNREDLDTLGQSGATLAIHLSINNLKHVADTLIPHYGADCPVVIAYRIGWPDQTILRGVLSDIREKAKSAGLTRTALILVGRVFAAESFPDSKLYAAGFTHVLRPAPES